MKDRATLESNLFQHYAERLYTSPKSSDDKKANGVLAHLSALSKSAREQQGHTSLWAGPCGDGDGTASTKLRLRKMGARTEISLTLCTVR